MLVRLLARAQANMVSRLCRAHGDFPVLAGIKSLTIFGELDDGGANRRKAEQCASRWREADCEVLWVRPLIGNDLNDALGGGAS